MHVTARDRALLLVVLVGVTACSNATDPTLASLSRNVTPAAVTSKPASTLDSVAWAFAQGLRVPETRRMLRDEFRRSRLTEHKLDLQAFVATPSGQVFVSAAARASGIPQADLASMVARLPAMDFYVPSRHDRRTWNGAGQVVVLAAAGGDHARTLAYTTNGAAVVWDASDFGRGPVGILISAAEPKGIRADAQPDTPGEVIQDQDDGELSVTHIEILANGDSIVRPVSSLRNSVGRLGAVRHAIANVGGFGAGDIATSSSATYVWNMVVLNVCDNNNCAEGNEFEWKAWPKCGVCVGEYKTRVQGIPSTVDQFLNVYLLPFTPGISNGIDVQVYETDSGGDDFFGGYNLNAGNTAPTGVTNYFHAGANRCGTPLPGFNTACPSSWSETNTRYFVQ